MYICILVYVQYVPLQRVHSARVYTQTLELYRGKGWALAEVWTLHYCTHYTCCMLIFPATESYIHVHAYVRDQLKTWPVLKSSDGFKAGQTVSKQARRLRNGPDGFPT